MRRRPVSSLAFFVVPLLSLVAGTVEASKIGFKPGKHVPKSCELPGVFYSSRHRAGQPPCCASVIGMCGGGTACPPSGTCADGKSCVAAATPSFPNVVLMIPDDLGECHYGFAGECRSVQTGTPVVAPETPNLDLLAGHGTVFPIAHNTSPWCFPSLTSMLTGRYQKSMQGNRRPATAFGTIATSLRNLDDSPFLTDDPYTLGDKVGGYCTFLGGKLTGSIGDNGFDFRARTGERVLGRTLCVPGPVGQPPLCGGDQQATYQPTTIFRLGDVFSFLDSLLYQVPATNPAQFRMQPFFVWYAPRIPHQPLRSPQPIRDYLFGAASYPLGGLFNLGALCTGGSCPPTVTAMNETNFGTVYEMFGNVWWMDHGLREIRKYLARQSEQHCIGSDGTSLFDVPQASCSGTWAASVAPNPAGNTIIITMADNGWHLPNSKHTYTENGYRSRLIVFDPRVLPSVPGWNADQEVAPPAQESPALAHATDIHTTIVGYALNSTPGSQLCPRAMDGSRCDGKDLRPFLVTAAGGPAPAAMLRHSMCGHETQKSTSPDQSRYLITREGSVGRCTNLAAPACGSDADCGGAACVGGHCMPRNEPFCSNGAQCPTGAVCLGGKCRSAPSCVEDADCGHLFPGQSYACVEKDARWCRNDPSVRCTTRGDCPACPLGGACGRVCDPRRLKFYYAAGASEKGVELADLFLDPDEDGLHQGKTGSTKLLHEISKLDGPYGSIIRKANCCVDAWWPDPASLGTNCAGGCPADLTCNK